MKEFGLEVKIKDKIIQVYFLPMSYLDWIKYSRDDGTIDPDPPVVRYILYTYVTRAYIVENTTTTDLEVSDLLLMGTAITNSVLRSLSEKSLFSDNEKYANILVKLEERTRTLQGSYDYFIFINGGIDLYLRVLELDALNRAQVIAMLEKATGICVSDRFEHSISLDIPLDMITPTDKYTNQLQRDMKQGKIEKNDKIINYRQKGNIPVPDKKPVDTSDLHAASRNALARELENARRNKAQKARYFNWHEDQADISRFDNAEDKDLLNRVHPSKSGS